jgi:hypothetical protein
MLSLNLSGASDGKCKNLWNLVAVNDGATRDVHDGHATTTVLEKYEIRKIIMSELKFGKTLHCID